MKFQSRLKVFVASTMLIALSVTTTAFAKLQEGDKLTVIHVNDRHGHVEAEPYVSQMAENLKAAGDKVIILDAGDSVHGQTITNIPKGASMVDIMNAVGYSAMSPGNHDFNFGLERLMELRDMMEFPLLAANVKTKDKGEYIFEKYTLLSAGDVKIGIFGLATPETITKSNPEIVKNLIFESPVETAEAMAKELRETEECDIVIALVHLGVDKESDPENTGSAVAAVEGIDLVVDGHSHTQLDNGEMIGDTLLVQTGSQAANIGVAELIYKDGKLEKSAKLVAVPAVDEETTLAKNEEIQKIIDVEMKKNEETTSKVIGSTPVVLQGEREDVRTKETNLANVITDSMRIATNADVAFLTGGNIRASIPAGDITMGQILTTLPFSNLLATVQLKGSDLLGVLEHGVSEYPNAAGQNIQVSGIKFEFDPSLEAGKRVTSVVMEDGAAFDPEKIYKVATIDFITSGGDGYEMMANASDKVFYIGDAEALINYIETKPAITAETKGRITPKAVETAVEAPALVAEVAPVEVIPVEVTPAEKVEVEAQSDRTYTVVAGDTLWRIAKEYNTTIDAIVNANGIKNRDLIYPEQVFMIP